LTLATVAAPRRDPPDLVEAPNKEAAERVHREVHGLVADELIEVQKGN
jgi:hypothetical protein